MLVYWAVCPPVLCGSIGSIRQGRGRNRELGVTLILLAVVITITATINIVAEYRGPRSAVYFFKPLTTVLIIALAAVAEQASVTYQWLIVAGLVFSLAGDVFLMLPETPRSYFVPGLIVFLIAHVFYIGAFSLGVHWSGGDALVLLPFVAFGIGTGAYLWRHLGPMKGPVAVYIVVILAMGWRAGARIGVDGIGTTGAVLALVGAILFILSDLILALNRFVRPFRSARATNLTTYWGGQLLIALSVHF
jgi:uncharacterized membrane protein YhhN